MNIHEIEITTPCDNCIDCVVVLSKLPKDGPLIRLENILVVYGLTALKLIEI
jgi:hypothetical protein